MLHREVGVRYVGAAVALHLDAALGQVGRELVVRDRLRREFIGHALDHIVLVVQEGQPARLLLLDDGDLDAIDDRQALAGKGLGKRHAAGIVGRRMLVVEDFTKAGVAFEHHARAAPPLREPEGPGAHRVLGDLVAVELDHLARQGTDQAGVGELLRQARRRFGQAHLETETVEHA